LKRPEYWRAALTAFSLASAPPRVKKKRVDVAGHELGEQLAEAGPRRGRQARGDEQQLAVELALHRLDHLGVRVADVDAHQLAVEVEVALAVGRVEVHALGALDDQRVDGAALRP
jgi:hypothetical protein